MATTYEAIATVEVGSGGAASIEFTSIAADWTDLAVLVSARFDTSFNQNTGAGFCRMTLNNNTSNYTTRWIVSDGSNPPASYSNSNRPSFPAGGTNQTASTFGNALIYIPNYAGSNNKSISIDAVNETNATSAFMELKASLWSDSAAITSIKFEEFATGANFLQYSTATLYGIKKD